jgi:hypothetical protein
MLPYWESFHTRHAWHDLSKLFKFHICKEILAHKITWLSIICLHIFNLLFDWFISFNYMRDLEQMLEKFFFCICNFSKRKNKIDHLCERLTLLVFLSFSESCNRIKCYVTYFCCISGHEPQRAPVCKKVWMLMRWVWTKELFYATIQTLRLPVRTHFNNFMNF